MRDAFRPLESLRPVINRLERHVEMVRDVARILERGRWRPEDANASGGGAQHPASRLPRQPLSEASAPEPSRPPAAQVKRVLRCYLNRLEERAPRRGRGAQTGHFVDHVVKVSESYWPGLFHAYDHPQIPRTSNGIEALFGSSKRSLRSTSGRASTAGGKMESCGEFVIGAQALTGLMPKAEIEQRLMAVPDAAFEASKRQLLRIREPARERRSIQRRLTEFLDHTLTAWLGEPFSGGP